jgi:TonB-dependent starch-binding outer membrane protein SusC
MKRINFLPGRVLSFLVFLLLTTAAFAQGWEVTGTVTDSQTGEAVVGGNVVVQGTTIGTITNYDGTYRIDIQDLESVLEFSFVGMDMQQIAVGDRTVINVQLSAIAEDIEEVVVIGYGTQKKEDLTGSITVVDAESLQKANASSIGRALQGKAPGVVVTQSSGMPGSGTTIRVRGIGSINANPNPLFVVDGVFVGGIDGINPADIESLQILKDASATAIYGARGANGVIIVTTKRGKEGPPKVNFNAYVGVTQLAKRFDVMDADQYTDFYEQAYTQYYLDHPEKVGELIYPVAYGDSARAVNGSANTDWQDLILQMGRNQNYGMSVSGGGENSNFAISGNYYSEEGILVDTKSERFTLRANSDFRITDWLKIGESMAINRNTTNNGGSPWVLATIASPLMPVYSESLGGFAGPTDSITAVNEASNPYAEQILRESYSYNTGILTSLYAEIDFLKHFKYRMNYGFNYYTGVNSTWAPEYVLGNLGNRSNPESSRYMSMSYGSFFLIENTLTYANSFGDHNLTVLAGHTVQWSPGFGFNATGSGFDDPNFNVLDQASLPTDVNGSEWDHRMEGMLARAIYDYKGKYLLTASVRRDGSSNFGPSYKYGVFPSFSLGWKLNEDLLQNVDEINLLKVRFGWGKTGNENIGSYRYSEVIDQPDKSQYAFGVNQLTHYGAASIWSHGNPYVHWEAATMTNIGVDLNAFNNRLQFIGEYYYKRADDMLVQIGLSGIYGKSSEANPWTNLGEVVNQGFETSLVWKKYEGDFHYSIAGNIATIKNEVIQLAGDSQPIIENNTTITQPGNSIGSFYGWVAEGIFQSQEEVDAHAKQELGTSPGDIMFKDLNQDGTVNDLDRTIIGKPIPDFTIGLNLEADYRGFDAMVFFQGAFGQEVYNQHRSNYGLASGNTTAKDWNKTVDVFDYWSETNPSTTQTRISIVDENRNNRLSTWWIDDASFLRLKTVQLGYTFSDNIVKSLNMSHLRIYVTATNLYTFTKYRGYDPEVSNSDSRQAGNPLRSGIDSGNYPVPRTLMAGIQVNF